MPTTPEAIAEDIAEAATAGFRGRLIARGQARAIIWRDGILPPDAPDFAPQLSYDLHSHGYALLGLGLRLRELGGDEARARVAFEQAATALEAVIAKGNREEVDRDFHFVMAAASYHLAHLSARAYSLLAIVETDENFSPVERMLAHLMRRSFTALRASVLDFRTSGEGSDARIVAAIQARLDQIGDAADPIDGGHDFLFEGLDTALIDAFLAAMSLFLLALERGERPLLDQALERLRVSFAICSELNLLPQWWAHRIAIHLLSDLWSNSFHEKVPLLPVGGEAAEWPQLRELFIALLQRRPKAEIDLWPSQIEAATRAVDQGDDLVVSLPTSAGKTRILSLVAVSSGWCRQPFAFDWKERLIFGILATVDPYNRPTRRYRQIDRTPTICFIWFFTPELQKIPAGSVAARACQPRAKLRGQSCFTSLRRSSRIVSPAWKDAADEIYQ